MGSFRAVGREWGLVSKSKAGLATRTLGFFLSLQRVQARDIGQPGCLGAISAQEGSIGFNVMGSQGIQIWGSFPTFRSGLGCGVKAGSLDAWVLSLVSEEQACPWC